MPVTDANNENIIVELTKAEGWYYAWYNMPKYEQDGTTPIYYYVRELGTFNPETGKYDKIPGYNVEYGTLEEADKPIAGGDYIITNRKTFAVKAAKKWVDANGNTIWPPEGSYVEVQLMRTTEDTITANTKWEKVDGVENPVRLDSKNLWKCFWEDLPEKDANGKKYTYTVQELNVPDGFQVEYKPELTTGGISAGGTTDTVLVTNKQLPKTEITVNKVWENPLDALPYVWVQLYQGKQQQTDYKEKYGDPIKLSAENRWTYTWENLPKGEEWPYFTYFVEELPVPGFDTEYTHTQKDYLLSGAITITNRKVNKDTGLSVWKQWENADGTALIDPAAESVQLQLYQQKGVINIPENSPIVTVDLLGTKQSKQVPAGTELGVTVIYYCDYGAPLSVPDGFIDNAVWDETANARKHTITGNFVITDDVTWTFKKINNDIAIKNPSLNFNCKVDTVQWEPDGTAYGDIVTINNNSNWHYNWSSLPAQNADGTEFYRYYVKEVGSNDYTVIYTVNGKEYWSAKDGTPNPDDVLNADDMPGVTDGSIIITNRVPSSEGYELPESGGIGTLPHTFGGLLLMAAPLIYGCRLRRKSERRIK